MAGKSEQLGRASHFHTAKEVLTAPHGVDYLGPANAEQRTERKEQRRAERRAALRHAGVMAAFYAVMAFGAVVGLIAGALNPDMVLAVFR